MSQYQNHRRCGPILMKFESKIPSLMSLSVTVVLINWDKLRALWRASKITSHLKFSSSFTKCTTTKESFIPFVILPLCKWVKLCHSKVWVRDVMGTDSRRWSLQKVDAKARKTCSKTDVKYIWRKLSAIFCWLIMGPWLSFFGCLINLTHELMKNFSNLDVHS